MSVFSTTEPVLYKVLMIRYDEKQQILKNLILTISQESITFPWVQNMHEFFPNSF